MTLAGGNPQAAQGGREGRPRQAYFGWDSAAPSPQRSPSPSWEGEAGSQGEADAAESKRIQFLKLDLSAVSTATPPSPAEIRAQSSSCNASTATEPPEIPSPSFGASPRRRSSVAKSSQTRFKLPLSKTKRQEKQGEIPPETVLTPSTCAGTAEPPSPRWTSKHTYSDLAADLLEAGSTSLQRAGRDPHFSEALACQGLVVGDLMPSSGLSVTRRQNLLAAVLQEKDLVQRTLVESTRGAKVLRSQLQSSVDELAGKMLSHREQHDGVARRSQSIASETVAQQQARAREEVERQARVRERDEASVATRRTRSRERSVQWQSTVARGHEVVEARVEERREFLRQQDARIEQCLGRREEARAEKRQQLQEHFETVLQAAEVSRQETVVRMMEQEENLQTMLKRSEEHLEVLRAAQERRIEQRRQESREREHEVVRVQRAQAYARSRKAVLQEEDSALFKQCTVLREQLSALARAKVCELSTSSSG